MSKISIAISSSFFSESSVEYFQKSELIKQKEQKKDVDLTTQHLGRIQDEILKLKDATFTFDKVSEVEIGRINYRGDKTFPQEITIANFKEFLRNKKTEDETIQNLILYLLLQDKIGLPVAIGKLMSSLLIGLASSDFILSVPTDYQKTELEFHKDGSVSIHLIMPIAEGYMEKGKSNLPKVGLAKLSICIKPDEQIIFSNLDITLKEHKVPNSKKESLLQTVQAKLTTHKAGNLENACISAPSAKKLNFEQPKAKNKVMAFISNHKWAIASFAGAFLFTLIGLGLCSTGVFSPLGLFFGGIGIKLGITGGALLAADLAVFAAAGIISGLMTAAAKKIATYTYEHFKEEKYIITPASPESLEIEENILISSGLSRISIDLENNVRPQKGQSPIMEPVISLNDTLSSFHPPIKQASSSGSQDNNVGSVNSEEEFNTNCPQPPSPTLQA